MKKFLIFVSTAFIVGIVIGFLAIPNNSNQQNFEIIFDAPTYANISTETLFEELGNPKYSQTITNETSKGSFSLRIYSYNLKNSYVEFLTNDSNVVRVRYFLNNIVSFGNDYNNILKLFNINPDTNMLEEATDIDSDLKFSNVSENIEQFEIYGVDKISNTFESASITYDLSYFD